MVGWHHPLDGHGFGWTLGVGDGQRGLAYLGSWGRKESDTIELLYSLIYPVSCFSSPSSDSTCTYSWYFNPGIA